MTQCCCFPVKKTRVIEERERNAEAGCGSCVSEADSDVEPLSIKSIYCISGADAVLVSGLSLDTYDCNKTDIVFPEMKPESVKIQNSKYTNQVSIIRDKVPI